jgi:hypothetical protein
MSLKYHMYIIQIQFLVWCFMYDIKIEKFSQSIDFVLEWVTEQCRFNIFLIPKQWGISSTNQNIQGQLQRQLLCLKGS